MITRAVSLGTNANFGFSMPGFSPVWLLPLKIWLPSLRLTSCRMSMTTQLEPLIRQGLGTSGQGAVKLV
jgi:hypothetical protein